MEGLRQKALDERLRNLDVPDRKVRWGEKVGGGGGGGGGRDD